MKSTELNGEWTLRFHHPLKGAQEIPAKVPGNVELDLARAGLLTEDPLPADRSDAEHWIDLTDWEYERTFDFDGVPEDCAEVQLRFEGLDTAATVLLNGEEVLSCCNMFIAHTADVTGKLKIGPNTLTVKIQSPEIFARSMPPVRPGTWIWRNRSASQYLRKARHMWGWDHAPHRVTSGIWREVFLDYLPSTRFESAYAATLQLHQDEDFAELGFAYEFTTSDRDLSDYRLRVRMIRDGKTEAEDTYPVVHTSGIVKGLVLKHPALWFPFGYGSPNLYDCELTLEKAGNAVAVHTHKMGVRVIRLERTDALDEAGRGEFQFYCNEVKIYVRGTNWKTLSPYPSETPQKLEKALKLVQECNCNMVRIWGGGVYEDTPFFDFCDRNGIMVWQDFMMACEFPPQDELFRKMLAEEAEAVVRKFRNHASLALWCGDNEDDENFYFGISMGRFGKPSDNRITREIIAWTVQFLDPERSYLPSSPYVPDKLINREKGAQIWLDMMPVLPEQHPYPAVMPRGGARAFFRSIAAHFSSEAGPACIVEMSETPEFVERELPRLKKYWGNIDPLTLPEGFIHQSDALCAGWCHGTKLLTKEMFGREFSPDNLPELVKATNFYCSDFLKHLVESWRIQKFRRTGVIWWSLLDMWPMAFNNSVVDAAFRKKLTFDVLRLAQQPQVLIGKDPEAVEAKPELWAANDTLDVFAGICHIFSEDGTELDSFSFEVAPNAARKIGTLPVAPKTLCAMKWEGDGKSGSNVYWYTNDTLDFEQCTRWSDIIRQL